MLVANWEPRRAFGRDLHVWFAFKINHTRSWVDDEFEEGRPVGPAAVNAVRNNEELGEQQWSCGCGGGKEKRKLENIYEPKPAGRRDWLDVRYNGTKGEIKNRIQFSSLGDWADIGTNNCNCELLRINQIEGGKMGLVCPLNISWKISPEGCEIYKSR